LGDTLKYIYWLVIVSSFPNIVKVILKRLPKNDYPVLNIRLFLECWLSYALDNGLTSMRDLFKLNNTGFEVEISTFSKASSHRTQKPSQEIYQKLNQLVQNKIHNKLHDKYTICPTDSTIITLFSKLLWVLDHHPSGSQSLACGNASGEQAGEPVQHAAHQVKLLSFLNLATESSADSFINFGYNHDYQFGFKIKSNLINLCESDSSSDFTAFIYSDTMGKYSIREIPLFTILYASKNQLCPLVLGDNVMLTFLGFLELVQLS